MGRDREQISPGGSPPVAERLARLDGLRGIAACVVSAWHLQILYAGGLGTAFGGVFDWLYVWGWAFVDLFFVLSGYIFAHVYLSTEGALRSGRQLADFAAARIARLYPLHLVMLLVVLVLDWGRPENTVRAFVAHLFMLQGLVPHAQDGFVGPSWSTSIEMACYVLFALAACAGGKVLERLTVGAVALIALHLALQGQPGGPWESDDLLRGVLGFFTGQLLWRYRVVLRRIPVGGLVAGLALGTAAAAWRFSPLLPLVLLAWPALLLLALRLRLFEAHPLAWIGDRSYAIYLIHYPVLKLFAAVLGPQHPGALDVIALNLAFAAAVFLLADLALRTVERPGRAAIRQAWQERRSGPGPIPLPFPAEVD